ncbi:chromosome partitioning protein [Frankia sp. Hr75.2]|uniref:ParA family protein n=1 Tax=Parafrankia soli TaxID=2599596 RepID=UPI0028A5142A|nr:chromosome partitioning protein [Frankia sp. Hr75.2]
MISMALFNNKGGVGKTTLAYHLAHMFQRMGHRVLAVDLDPQANLTAQFLDEDELASLWKEDEGLGSSAPRPAVLDPRRSRIRPGNGTLATAIEPIMEGVGDVRLSEPVTVEDGLWLLPGDVNLASFEDRLSAAWPNSFLGRDVAALRTTTALHRAIDHGARETGADIVIIDVGPNLGAINRAALLSADTILMPLAADLFSLRGLRNIGPTLRDWRVTWQGTILPRIPERIPAPRGLMMPIGYILVEPPARADRPSKGHGRWLDRIPGVFTTSVLGSAAAPADGDRSFEIATMKNYAALMPLAQDARKPMFELRAGDGAVGGTQSAVRRCFSDFRELATKVRDRLVFIDPTLRRG